MYCTCVCMRVAVAVAVAAAVAVPVAVPVCRLSQTLDLSFNPVCRGHDALAKFAEFLRYNTTVTHLDLSHCVIGPEELGALSAGLNHNTTLRGLHMQGAP